MNQYESQEIINRLTAENKRLMTRNEKLKANSTLQEKELNRVISVLNGKLKASNVFIADIRAQCMRFLND